MRKRTNTEEIKEESIKKVTQKECDSEVVSITMAKSTKDPTSRQAVSQFHQG